MNSYFSTILENDSYYNIMISFAVVLFGFFINFIFKRNPKGITDLLKGSTKKHQWVENSEPLQTSRCSICEILLVTVQSFYCDTCGVSADVQCLKKANNKVDCKKMFFEEDGPMKHCYVKGNLPFGSECEVCRDECGHDLRCIWCHLTVHTNCKKNLAQESNRGLYGVNEHEPQAAFFEEIHQQRKPH